MANTLKINASKIKDTDGKEYYERSLTVDTPNVLLAETLADMVNIVGEDYILHTVKAGMKIAYRGKIRTTMEKRDDNGEFEFDDATILENVADVNWTPELRVTKSQEEKVDEALSAMDPEKLKALLKAKMAELNAQN